MEEYKDISRGLKTLLDKAEEMGWNWEAYIEPDNRRTYVEIGQSSPAGEDFSMTIDFDEGEDIGIIGGGGQYQLAVTEGVFHSL